MHAPAPRGLIYAVAALIAAVVVTVTLMVLRWYYAQQVAPGKDHPNGRIVAEFWTEAGRVSMNCAIFSRMAGKYAVMRGKRIRATSSTKRTRAVSCGR